MDTTGDPAPVDQQTVPVNHFTDKNRLLLKKTNKKSKKNNHLGEVGKSKKSGKTLEHTKDQKP